MHLNDPAPRRPPSRGELRAAVSFASVFLALMTLEMLRDHTPAKLSMAFVTLAWLPMLVVHELGHALMARALGWKVLEMVIGYGQEIVRFEIGGTLVALRALPTEGHVVPTPWARPRARLKSALVYAAGPGAELLVIAAIGTLLGFDVLFSHASDIHVIALQSVALVGAISVVFNLVPHALSGAPNDGLGIFLSARMPAAALEYKLALPYLFAAHQAFDRDDVRAAHAHVSAGLAAHPHNIPLQILLARCEVGLHDAERGMARLQALRAEEGLAEVFEAERLHGAAAAALESGERAWLQDAEAAARAAVERAPSSTEYLITLGAIQLELQQLSRAATSFEEAYRRARQPLLEDRCLSYLALTAHAKGQSEQALLFARALKARTRAPRLLARVEPWSS